jgi:hypothetical protein
MLCLLVPSSPAGTIEAPKNPTDNQKAVGEL